VKSDAKPAPQGDGAVALRPEKVRIAAPGAAAAGENRFAGTVTGLLYHGDVTVYRVRTERGHEMEALLANSASGLARFFEVGDAVELAWPADAGHFVR
jgi:spermidine/putrescine transport system ATP-binding protein